MLSALPPSLIRLEEHSASDGTFVGQVQGPHSVLESVFQHAHRRSLASLKFSDQKGVTYFLEAPYFIFFFK